MQYITIKEHDQKARNKWFRECQRKQIPCVMVLEDHKGISAVDWDCFTVPPQATARLIANDKGDAMLTMVYCAALAMLDSKHRKKCGAYGDAFSGRVEGLDLLSAHEMAGRVIDHLYAGVMPVGGEVQAA